MAWNGSSKGGGEQPTKEIKRPSSLQRPILIGLPALVLGLLVAVYVFHQPEEVRPKAVEKKPVPAQIQEVTPTPRQEERSPEIREVEPPAEEKKKEEKPWEMPTTLEAVELEKGVVLSEVPSNMPESARNPYKTEVECILSMLGKPGTPYTPVPIDPNLDLDEDFLKAMENTIIVWEDESQESEEHKKAVNWMKNAIAEARKEGWKVGDLLQELEKERKQQWEILSEAEELVADSERNAPLKTAEVRASVNEALEAAGVDPIEKTQTEELVEELKKEEDLKKSQTNTEHENE